MELAAEMLPYFLLILPAAIPFPSSLLLSLSADSLRVVVRLSLALQSLSPLVPLELSGNIAESKRETAATFLFSLSTRADPSLKQSLPSSLSLFRRTNGPFLFLSLPD